MKAGKLVLAATCSGNTGEDITVNARTIRSIPLRLQRRLAKPLPLRKSWKSAARSTWTTRNFHAVNKEIEAEGEEPYANPRNLTAGTLRRLDPKIVAKRRLSFLVHGLGQVEPPPIDSWWEFTRVMRQWGLPLPKEVSTADSVDEVLRAIEAFEAVRPKLPYMTDGIVIIAAEAFQLWKLTVDANRTAVLTCEDGNGKEVYRMAIPYTDFPLPTITMYFIDNVILLPSEY